MKKQAEPYEHFALVYDEIMDGVDYDGWADYVEKLLEKHGHKPGSLVDLGCGTGSSTLPFARKGYMAAGVDLSEAMLSLARRKAESEGLSDLTFYKQDLCTMNLPRKYDLALLFQDGLNYILDEKLLSLAFERINSILEPEALFIFDLTRPKHRPNDQGGNVHWVDLEQLTLIWESDYCFGEEIWTVILTAFRMTENGLYEKFRETHKEKDYSPDTVSDLLSGAGFKILGLYPSFKLEPIGKDSCEPKITLVSIKIK